MRFHLESFGCRTNQADAVALAGELLARGHQAVDTPEQADLVILNTCTVTAAADRQARERIRQLGRLRPRGGILVTGCYAERAPEELAALPGVRWVVGHACKRDILTLFEAESATENAVMAPAGFVPLSSLEPSAAEPPAKILRDDLDVRKTLWAAPFSDDLGDRTRPVLKIQDGCDHRCAYCVIPLVRGRSRSLPPAAVLAIIGRWVAAGVQEIVLSGIDLGSYGCDLKPRTTLRALAERILAETALPLLRFSSIEPADLKPEFLRLFATSPRIARHIHAPLQSGSDRILRRMGRPYRAEDYAARILDAAAILRGAGIGADVIVGFPGESEGDFAATCELVARLPFSYLHVFSFSKRPGTRAWAMADEVPPMGIRERARALRALAAEKQRRFLASQVGWKLKVLTLRRVRPDGRREALSENYLKVALAGADIPANQLLWASVQRVGENHLIAEPLTAVPIG